MLRLIRKYGIRRAMVLCSALRGRRTARTVEPAGTRDRESIGLVAFRAD